ncbi:MAG: hypothetical protein KGI29_03215, partial [Pseudomonadota bacterium]|nr:hypothetical protein [Pseudomonadota bacterium]MDE3037467.1 hypothetical protein [Pseudomonadota bacterium]
MPVRAPVVLRHLRSTSAIAVALAALYAPAGAYALPSGGVVSAGQAVIAQRGTVTTVTQSSGRA